METLNDAHPMQIISDLTLKVTVFKVDYTYTTSRGNQRQGEKYFIFQSLDPQRDMKQELYNWVEKFNKENEYRQLLNVKFLSSKCLGFKILE